MATNSVESAKDAARDAVARYLNDPGSAYKHLAAKRALDELADAVSDDYWQPAPDPVPDKVYLTPCPHGGWHHGGPCSSCTDS